MYRYATEKLLGAQFDAQLVGKAPFFSKLDDADLTHVNYDFIDGNGEVDREEMKEAIKFFFPLDDPKAAWRKHPGWKALGINGGAVQVDP